MCACALIRRKDRSFWKELNENIIYYQSDSVYHRKQQHLRIMNVKENKEMEYLKIAPKSLGLLNKHNSYLNVFIETKKSTIMAKLYKASLRLKISYRIFQEYLFYEGPIYHFSHNILYILQNRRLIQLIRNKQIRRYKGNLHSLVSYAIIKKMGLQSFNLFRKSNQLFLTHIQNLFQAIFNISLQEIDQKYGTHIFKKIGNFIILKKQYKYQDYKYQDNKFQQKRAGIPVYYIGIDVLTKGDGFKGKLQLDEGKTLKVIKQFHNSLYAIITFQNYYQVHEIMNDQLLLISQVYNNGNNLKKPILQQQNLIFTCKSDQFHHQIHRIDLKKNAWKKN